MVFSAADKLAEQGIMPTAKKLLVEIGMGSLTTHSKYLKQWQQVKANDDNRTVPLSLIITGLSSEATVSFESAIKACWRQGYEQGQKDSDLVIKQLKEQLTKLEQKNASAVEKRAASKGNPLTSERRQQNKKRKPFQGLKLGGYHASKDN